jgi:hypothetical protein
MSINLSKKNQEKKFLPTHTGTHHLTLQCPVIIIIRETSPLIKMQNSKNNIKQIQIVGGMEKVIIIKIKLINIERRRHIDFNSLLNIIFIK